VDCGDLAERNPVEEVEAVRTVGCHPGVGLGEVELAIGDAAVPADTVAGRILHLAVAPFEC
jgi:hypothetical protein